MCLIFMPLWLLYVDLAVQLGAQEGCVHVCLLYWPAEAIPHAKDVAYSGVGGKCESFSRFTLDVQVFLRVYKFTL